MNIFKNPIHFLAFGFGSGLSPKAPGTLGTLVALPIYYFLAQLPLIAFLRVLLFMTIAGFWICEVAERDSGVADHAGIVWDEIVGYLWTMCFITFSWLNVLLGFLLFRLFDICKPWPIHWLDQRVKGGIGIMVDDILAAAYAGLVLKAIETYFL